MRLGKLALCSILLAMSLVLASCDDDDAAIPSYITDFVTAHSNSEKLVDRILFDDGCDYALTKQKIQASAADSAYRCIATYAVQEDGERAIYMMEPVVSTVPKYIDEMKTGRDSITHAPVKVVSVWKGRGYVNIHLGTLVQGVAAHMYGFLLDSIANGTEYVSLLHFRPSNDGEAYTSNVYMSMPMVKRSEDVERFVLRINTYDGWKSYEFK